MNEHSGNEERAAVTGGGSVDETRKTPVPVEPDDARASDAPGAGGVRPASDAKGRIADALRRACDAGAIVGDVDEATDAASAVVDALYEDYEADGTVPTREAFAGRCAREDVGGVVLAMRRDPFVRGRAGVKVAACAVVVAVVAGLGIGAWAMAGGHMPGSGDAPATERAAASEEAEDAVTCAVRLVVDAPGWAEGSSPFIAHVVGLTDDGEAVDFYHAVWPDGSTDRIELAAGSYRIGWTSAINADGSIYRTPEEPTEVVVDASSDDGTDPVMDAGASFEQVPAGDVTQDDLDAILGDIEQAVGAGDETLSGDAGQEVVDVATGNAANNPNADKEKVEQAGEEASGNVSDETREPGGTGAGGSAAGGSNGTSSGGSHSTGTAGNAGGASSSGASGGGSSSSGSSKPSHTHDWVAQTTQRWVQDSAAWDEDVWVQDSAAWDETVQTGSHILCSCGATFGSNEEWTQHNKAQGPGNQHRYSVVPTYETVHHEATGHYETVHHEATGHYETVTTGYRCSGCGATK